MWITKRHPICRDLQSTSYKGSIIGAVQTFAYNQSKCFLVEIS